MLEPLFEYSIFIICFIFLATKIRNVLGTEVFSLFYFADCQCLPSEFHSLPNPPKLLYMKIKKKPLTALYQSSAFGFKKYKSKTYLVDPDFRWWSEYLLEGWKVKSIHSSIRLYGWNWWNSEELSQSEEFWWRLFFFIPAFDWEPEWILRTLWWSRSD